MAISGSAWPFQAQRQRGFQVFLVKLSTTQQDLQTTTSQAILKLLAPSEIIDFFTLNIITLILQLSWGFVPMSSWGAKVAGQGSRAWEGAGASQPPVRGDWGLRRLPWSKGGGFAASHGRGLRRRKLPLGRRPTYSLLHYTLYPLPSVST